MRARSIIASFLALSLSAACGSSSTGTDGGTGTDAGITGEQACTASALAQCTQRQMCSGGYLVTRDYGDMTTCMSRVHDQCLAALSATGTGNTPTTVMACAAAYATYSCTDYLNGNPPTACQTQVGTLAAGAACHFPAQCASTFCNVATGTECGTCGPLPTAGTACNGPAATETCGGHLQACIGSDPTTSTAGACATFVTTVGGSCDTMTPCGAGLSCTPLSTTATGRTCQPAGATIGAACGGMTMPGCDNQKGLYCNGMTHQCTMRTFVAAGMPCGVNTDGTFSECSANGLCMGYTTAMPHGTCVAAASDTAACDRAAGPPCGFTSTCVTGGGTATAGTCQFPSAASCH